VKKIHTAPLRLKAKHFRNRAYWYRE